MRNGIRIVRSIANTLSTHLIQIISAKSVSSVVSGGTD